jgi:hypothetical protein
MPPVACLASEKAESNCHASVYEWANSFKQSTLALSRNEGYTFFKLSMERAACQFEKLVPEQIGLKRKKNERKKRT